MNHKGESFRNKIKDINIASQNDVYIYTSRMPSLPRQFALYNSINYSNSEYINIIHYTVEGLLHFRTLIYEQLTALTFTRFLIPKLRQFINYNNIVNSVNIQLECFLTPIHTRFDESSSTSINYCMLFFVICALWIRFEKGYQRTRQYYKLLYDVCCNLRAMYSF
jgi:hypothetical protein